MRDIKIIALIENTADFEGLESEHGLSLYIETKKQKIVFDLGASGKFIENAKKLNIDISEVDSVVISHGHYDHGGGIKEFLKHNLKAKIYLNQNAFDMHYSNKSGVEKYIGLDQELIPNDRFIFLEDYLRIDEELELFSDIKRGRPISKSNDNLLMKMGTSVMHDDFTHEQNLLIKEEGKTLLVAGCAHVGIINILEHISKKVKDPINYVIGGFHLHSPGTKFQESPSDIDSIGYYLKNLDTTFYTCHCTGIQPFKRLKSIMGENIHYLATGSTLTI